MTKPQRSWLIDFSILALIWGASFLFIAVAVILAIANTVRRGEMSVLQCFLWGIAYLMCRLLWRTRWLNVPQLPPGQGAIIVCNHRASVDPIVMKFLARRLDFLEILGPQRRGIKEISNIHAHAEVAAMAHFVKKVEKLKIAAGTVNASDAVFVGPFHSGAQSQKPVSPGRFGNHLGN